MSLISKSEYETKIALGSICEQHVCDNSRKKGSSFCSNCHLDIYGSHLTLFGSVV